MRIALRDGVVTGFDLAAAVAGSGLPSLPEAEAAVRRALTAGATAFERLEASGTIASGRIRVDEGRIAAEGGAMAGVSGSADLARGTLDLRVGVRPAAEGAPELGLSVTGPAGAPRALPETSDWARWRAEQGSF